MGHAQDLDTSKQLYGLCEQSEHVGGLHPQHKPDLPLLVGGARFSTAIANLQPHNAPQLRPRTFCGRPMACVVAHRGTSGGASTNRAPSERLVHSLFGGRTERALRQGSIDVSRVGVWPVAIELGIPVLAMPQYAMEKGCYTETLSRSLARDTKGRTRYCQILWIGKAPRRSQEPAGPRWSSR